MQRVLMIAYHFPPMAGSSGVQRTLRFSSHLPDFGWEPIVLTAHQRAYDQCSSDLLDQIRAGTIVIRAPAWDTKRHLAIAGRYPAFMARPDRWRWWWLGAVPAGMRAIRRYRPSAIWSTYPIATAHSIGIALARLSGLPWIADFRDPMAQEGYPSDPATWRSFARIERTAVARANLSAFTTPGAVRLYRQRYPEYGARCRLLENGYDEETFVDLEDTDEPLNSGRLTLLHSGIIYPSERDPTRLFEALRELRDSAPRVYSRLIVRFRAAVHETLLKDLARRYDVEAAIEILPQIAYREAVREMCRADGLLILQAGNCNDQIPAKFYEYLRAGRPLLLLTDPAGDTAEAARAAGVTAIADLERSAAIGELLQAFAANPTAGTLPTRSAVSGASRRQRTAELATWLDEAAGIAGGRRLGSSDAVAK